jgi:hypothetical protein
MAGSGSRQIQLLRVHGPVGRNFGGKDRSGQLTAENILLGQPMPGLIADWTGKPINGGVMTHDALRKHPGTALG